MIFTEILARDRLNFACIVDFIFSLVDDIVIKDCVLESLILSPCVACILSARDLIKDVCRGNFMFSISDDGIIKDSTVVSLISPFAGCAHSAKGEIKLSNAQPLVRWLS